MRRATPNPCWIHKPLALLVLASFVLALGARPWPVRAQGSDEDQEQDLYSDQQDDFSDQVPDQEFDQDTGLPPAPGAATGQEDQTEGNQYVDESGGAGVSGQTLQGARQQQIRVSNERADLPMNAAWGAGTGLLIGGWLALIGAGSNRDTQRNIGTGIVVGALVGLAVGAKSVINPNAPSPVADTGSPGSPVTTPVVVLDRNTLILGVNVTF